jgi:hypothetical protein
MSAPTPPPGYPPPGYPPPGYPAPAPAGYPAPAPPVKQGNGWAVASLIFGIIGGFVFGIIFGIIGLVRAGKVGGKGRAMSWIGIILSVLWLVGIGSLVFVAISKVANPGCTAAVNVVTDTSDKMSAAGSDPTTFKTELQRAIDGLGDAANQSTNSDATAAINKLKGDYQDLLTAVNTGNIPDDLLNRITTDASAVDTACGR